MKRVWMVFPLAVMLMLAAMAWRALQRSPQSVVRAAAPEATDKPVFTSDGKLEFPANYREWIYLSTGLDMSYRKETAGHGRPSHVR